MPATETFPQLVDAVGGFAQRTMVYQAQLAIDDKANNPWLTVAQKNLSRLIISRVAGDAVGRAVATAPGVGVQARIVAGVVPKANVVKV